MTKKSFTLIELIVVIAIIAILAAIIAPNAFKAIEKAKISRTMSDLRVTKNAVTNHYIDTGKWPLESGIQTELEWVEVYASSLIEDIHSYDGWDGPYLDGSRVFHPWKGIYALYSYDLEADGAPFELTVLVSNHCFPTPGVYCHPGTIKSLERIDEALDDGDLSDGIFRKQVGAGSDPTDVAEALYIYRKGDYE